MSYFLVSTSYREIVLCWTLQSSHTLLFRAKSFHREKWNLWEHFCVGRVLSMCLLMSPVFCKALQGSRRYMTLWFRSGCLDHAP